MRHVFRTTKSLKGRPCSHHALKTQSQHTCPVIDTDMADTKDATIKVEGEGFETIVSSWEGLHDT